VDIRKLFTATAYWPRGVSAAVVGIGARPVAPGRRLNAVLDGAKLPPDRAPSEALARLYHIHGGAGCAPT
jgi:hypothetical protein